ncbi:MAG: 3-isopropylmalate dehydratase large subunit [Desulfobacterales bacterium]|nr:3-isopropylmalate dehydratase large subunit [Desulfobacterales bacterium]
MGKTITEKIIARASNRKEVSPGDIVWADVDVLFTHETVGPRVFAKSFEELGDKIWDPDKFSVFIDHYNLPSTIRHAEVVKFTVDWCKSHGVKHLYNFCGPEHQVLIEEGFIRPGTVVIGTDSHTTTAGALGAFSTGIGSTDCAFALATGKIWLKVPPSLIFNWDGGLPSGVMAKDMALQMIGTVGHGGATYKACEFVGPLIQELSIDGRIVLSNMAVEMGAKNGIINPDAKTMEYVKERTKIQFTPVKSDEDAEYEKEYYFDGDDLEPLVAAPHNVDNVKPVSAVEGTKIDSILIGTCTGGRYEDMKAAARILRGKKIHPDTYAIIMPATWKIYREMLHNGLIGEFLDAGCRVTYPTCGPCAGHIGGLMAASEIRISAQNRNFKGRSGSPESEIYLASPMTCAASALKGEIADPRKYV